MVAHMKRMGGHKDAMFGTLHGTDAELSRYEKELLKEGYRVEYYTTRGVKTLHFYKEGMYDSGTRRETGPESGTVTRVAEGIPTFYAN